MSNLLVVATGPLLEEGSEFVSGQCLRTLHFVRPLWDQGHSITLITIPIPGTESSEHRYSISEKSLNRKTYQAIGTSSPPAIVPELEKILERPFDAVIGINPYPAYLVAQCKNLRIPFWADLNGYTMAEGQTRSARLKSDGDFEHFWRMEAKTLLAADRFSTVTERQAHCLFGELAMLGRFSYHTHEEQFAEAVPNAVYGLYQELKRVNSLPEQLFEQTPLHNLPANSKLILWSGGFNTWTDVGLLYNAIAEVLATLPTAHLVCTGGPVKGHDEKTYVQFLSLVENSPVKNRIHLLDWTTLDRVLALHARADVGINVDGNNTETRFGARNRLTNMLGAGLPVVTTRGTEIADWIERNGVGLVSPLSDAPAFAQAIIQTLAQEAETTRRAEKGRALALAEFSPAATLRPFLAWCANPCHASDFGKPKTAPQLKLEALLDGDYDRALLDSASLYHLRQKWPLKAWYTLKSFFNKST